MTEEQENILHYGLAVSLAVATACFLLVSWMGKAEVSGAITRANQMSFTIPQSTLRISAAVEKSLTTLGWEKQVLSVTASNMTLEALTTTGVPVKISAVQPVGCPTRISITAAASVPAREQAAQQLHAALLVALR